ncbi:MAG: MarR family transcriptional regulator [Candidatus Roizmanbacteria bacterium]|nr:MarR family transcriptional regulator [Candidatus Roizmanbacteria bacterium]
MFQKESSEEQIFLLIHRVMRLLRKQTAALNEEELSMGKLQALSAISQGKNTMGKIADDLVISLPSATSLVEKLVERGFVERTHDTHDRRLVLIHLTQAGEKKLKKATSTKMKRMSYLMEKISPLDKKNLFTILNNTYNALEQHNHEKNKT